MYICKLHQDINKIHKMSKKQMTEEQEEIVKSVLDYNVIVNAVAGSGKTTTILFMANAYPEKEFLLITYLSLIHISEPTRPY